ncbi:DUF6198 family protein [Jeotgalicoccus huakuii]|nr:DUF6198 family protein [Jeotgalicoccus huakuii]
MSHINVTVKRLFIYVLGLFFLSLGISFSIQANMGVSPVSSLAYALTLSSGISIGLMTVAANVLFIIAQIILSKRLNIREAIVQLIIAFLFGGMMDFTLFLVQLLPNPENLVTQTIFLLVSLFLVALGLLGYFNAKFPLMPYDELTHVISDRFNLEFSKAKVTSDMLNVIVAVVIGLIFTQTLGSIGIGTFVAALFVGKILGWMMRKFQPALMDFVHLQKDTLQESVERTVLEEQEQEKEREDKENNAVLES